MRFSHLLSLLILLLFVSEMQAQVPTVPRPLLTGSALSRLRKSEDSLKQYGKKIVSERRAVDRFLADSMFIRMLVRSLKTPNSFYYPFDSLKTISHLYAPDSSFRIFSWQFMRDDNYYRQRGAIQMRTDDGSLKLIPLLDMSDFTAAPTDSIRTPQNWIGAIYYSIILKTFGNRKYYTLIGFDDNNVRTTKKWVEVMTFDNQGRPVFGGAYFNIPNGALTGSTSVARFCMEYKKDAGARLNYDKDMDMIVYEHLVSETNEPDKAYTMIPDGDYLGFRWINGKWVQIEKVFDQKLQDGQAPVPMPLKDAAGKSDELKLSEQSLKNMQMGKPATPPPPPAKKPVPRQQDRQPSNSPESY